MGVETALAVAVVGSVVAAGTSAYSAYEQREAGKAAKKQAKVAARAEEATTAEKVRVLAEENRRKESLARARAAASGVGGASSEIYIAALEESGREDIAWLKEVGATKYQAAIASGESAYAQSQAAMWGSIGQAAGYVGQAATQYSQLPDKE